MKSKGVNSKILLWIAILLIAFFIGIEFYQNAQIKANGTNSISIWDALNKPLVYTAMFFILGFFVIERWRRNETEITNIRDKQFETLDKIRDNADKIVKEKIESATRHATAIESKLNKLTEDHPWITVVTDNEFIPNSNFCRIVLQTSEKLLSEGKDAVIYDYLSGFFNGFINKEGKSDEVFLKGTANDFLDLAEFCQIKLLDEYLAFLVIGQGQKYASNRFKLYPNYLRVAIRNGNYNEVKRVGKLLFKLTYPNKFIRYFLNGTNNDFPSDVRFLRETYGSLSLYFASLGKSKTYKTYLQLSKNNSKSDDTETYFECLETEIDIILGNQEKALERVYNLDRTKNTLDKMTTFHVARYYMNLGLTERGNSIIEEIREQPKRVSKSKTKKRQNSFSPSSPNVRSNKKETLKDVSRTKKSSITNFEDIEKENENELSKK